jgi:regulatory protein
MREHSRLELERKLQPHADSAEALSQVLDTLEAKKYIQPERVAESWVHRRAAKWGNQRLQHELEAKGLDLDTIDAALQSAAVSEQERAQQVWQKKYGQVATDRAEQAQQMRFLLGRGFAPDVVRRVVQPTRADRA